MVLVELLIMYDMVRIYYMHGWLVLNMYCIWGFSLVRICHIT